MENGKNKNNLLFLIIAPLCLVICIIWLSTYIISLKKYVKVNATIVDTEKDDKSDNGETLMVPSYYKTYEYKYKDNTYTSKVMVRVSDSSDKGEKEIIRIDKENPSKVFETFHYHQVIAVTLFILVFNILVFASNRKKEN